MITSFESAFILMQIVDCNSPGESWHNLASDGMSAAGRIRLFLHQQQFLGSSRNSMTQLPRNKRAAKSATSEKSSQSVCDQQH
jgi:hypothetical protein